MWDDGPTEEAVEKIGTLSLRHTIKRLLIWCINRSSGTYFHTGSLYHDKLVKMGVEREKLVNLPFFVKDTLRGKNILTEVKAKPVTGVKILAGGRLIHRKGYDLLIAALHHLVLQNLTSWNLTLVGSGPEECNLEKMIERFKLTPYVTKISWAEPSEFNQLIENCDVFVAPARFDPFPTTIISALRASKLVIATEKVGSAVEFIEDGVNGLLVPENSIDGLQDALSNAVSIESLRNSLSKNADKRVALWPVTRGVQLVIDAVYDSIDIKS
jgi:glycosyltransferase involved in cell wall biosynthesis